ncbi:hypothetical protein [Paraflavitalea sp. CAU 1676]|uniref:hypothetical protein n=1 Tax=Paraflavitalea sp. CAU 1676 TaxID=3032598 RepID=UPI0023DCD0A7|nr:hypothetical protein [Paraflavitalea sp. CAU 1676]MDF2192364.1 hypothetical protein [Paraflavitalea sp. CAU 1676]
MCPEQFKYRKLNTEDFKTFYGVGDRQALRNRRAVRIAYGLQQRKPIPFPHFFEFVNLPIEEVAFRLGWV